VVRSVLPRRLRIEIPGLYQRPGAAAGVATALAALPGVAGATVNPATGRALLTFDTPLGDLDRVLAEIAVAIAGAEPIDVVRLGSGAPRSSTVGQSERPVQRDWLRVIAGGVTVGALLVVRLAGGPLALASPPVAILATGAAIAVGLPTFINGLRPLLRFEAPEIDTLITTATFASLLVGEAATGLIVVWLIALGELVEEMTIDRTRRAIADLLAVGEEWVWVIPAGNDGSTGTAGAGANGSLGAGQAGGLTMGEVRVRLEDVRPGDVVVVHAGDKIPVDGEVLEGSAAVNQAPITGESLPVFRNPGDEVYAGTLVDHGSLLIRAARVGDDTAIGRIIRLVEEARDVQAPVQRLADRFSRRIVPLSFLLAGGVFALTGNVLRSMTILVIACPCAAGLATPTAVSAAIANAARRGILIKGGLHLETAGGVDAVVFDKTGTLTAGAPRVSRVFAVDDRYTPERVLALAASGELHSQHPLAAAVLQHTAERELEVPAHSEYEIIVGHGVRFAVDGTRLVIGSRHMLEDFAVAVTPQIETIAARLRRRGETVLWVAEVPEDAALTGAHEVRIHPEDLPDDASEPAGLPREEHAQRGRRLSRVIGLIGVTDVVRPEAAEALASLRAAGVEQIHMITGDSRESALIVADHLGIPHAAVVAEALPEAKLDLVRRLQREGHRVALVGDGVNDAPALAAADLGIAMGHGGADVALEAADIALASDDVRQVAEVIRLSRDTMRLVRQNFGASLGINGVGVVAGTFGLLSPFAAAVVHNVSTVAVVLNSGRLLNWRPPALHPRG
jgi:cation-transporting P-type ATPase C